MTVEAKTTRTVVHCPECRQPTQKVHGSHQDVRGRFRSDGRFEPWLREGPDGFDTIEWLARQPWCSGKVGTIGGSYSGVVQWQAAVERPPHLAAMVVNVPPNDRSPYYQGVLEYWGFMQWLYLIRGQKPEESSPMTDVESFPPPAFEKAFDDLPVAEHAFSPKTHDYAGMRETER